MTKVPLTTRSLDGSTWDAFAELVERNNGIYGGCWCIVHHPEYDRGVSDPRTLKRHLVHEGRAQAALVFDDAGLAQGWCQYGRKDQLLLKHRRGYEKEPPAVAAWRIACIFVDKRNRGRGVARAALVGALAQIAAAGGGLVEAVSEATSGRAAEDRFLFSATVEMFEDHDFTRIRQVGKQAWIVSTTIAPAIHVAAEQAAAQRVPGEPEGGLGKPPAGPIMRVLSDRAARRRLP